jgi:uncharacterized protein with FMN-binding domain
MPSYRMHRGLVAVSASAVAAIYMAGYVRTQSADSSIEAAAVPTLAASPAVAAAAPALAPPPTVTPVPQATSPRGAPQTQRSAPPTPLPIRPAATTAPAASTQTQGQYKDGTFTGQGSSRRGDVWVSVQVQGGQITNVTITRSTLQYPLRDIQGLPSEVVQRQSAQIDTVSRATYSSQAFRGAVTQALSAARAG